MLTFFRKIRRSLFDSGKISRYLFYAVGEILLVVIGILIALQINNWNEWRKEKQMEKRLLIELRENLKSDLEFCRSEIDAQTARIKNIEKLIKHLEAKLPYSDTLNFGSALILERFQANRTAYETLKNRGFEKLSSQILKAALSRYYDIDVPERSRIVNLLNEQLLNSRTNYRSEKMKTYRRDHNLFWFNVASDDHFTINHLYQKRQWLKNLCDDILQPNIKQVETIILNINDELHGAG
jgi:hypothetical protein